MRRCHRRFDRLLNYYLGKHDLKSGFWYYLRILWINDDVSQKYLSDMTNVAENTTASIINAMVAEGLVTRERDQQDKRKFCIRLTKRGRELEQELIQYPAQINRLASAGIEQAEIDTCLSVLKRMSENLASTFEQRESGDTQ